MGEHNFDRQQITIMRARVLAELEDRQTERKAAERIGIAYSTVRPRARGRPEGVHWLRRCTGPWPLVATQPRAVAALDSEPGCGATARMGRAVGEKRYQR